MLAGNKEQNTSLQFVMPIHSIMSKTYCHCYKWMPQKNEWPQHPKGSVVHQYPWGQTWLQCRDIGWEMIGISVGLNNVIYIH